MYRLTLWHTTTPPWCVVMPLGSAQEGPPHSSVYVSYRTRWNDPAPSIKRRQTGIESKANTPTMRCVIWSVLCAPVGPYHHDGEQKQRVVATAVGYRRGGIVGEVLAGSHGLPTAPRGVQPLADDGAHVGAWQQGH
jgi:hypothetical protein